MPNDPNKKWNYFTDAEVEGLDKELVAGLDLARHLAHIPFVLTSTVRTRERNAEVGGVADSEHITGHAADIRCQTSEECFKIVSSLLSAGFRRIVIGIRVVEGRSFFHNIHVGNATDKPSPVLSIKIYK